MSTLMNYFLRRPGKSATVARERLQIILAREHVNPDGPDFLPALKRDLLQVITRYIDIDVNAVQVNLAREGGVEVLEFNVVLPETQAQTNA